MHRNLTIVALAGMLVLSGCTSPTQTDSSSQGTSSIATVDVALGDVVPVLTLAGDVRSDVLFQITSPASGTFSVTPSGKLNVVGEDGADVPILVADGVHVESLLIAPGDPVQPALPIATARYSGFVLVAPLEQGDLLRFIDPPVSARAQIDGAGAPFECVNLDSRPSTVEGGSVEQFVGCLIPADQRVVVGLTGLVVLRFDGVSDVLTLPVEAVAGSRDSGSVYVAESGGWVEKTVELGLSDTFVVEIVSGLELGDEVALPSPSLLNG